jgi:hypothetical protein
MKKSDIRKNLREILTTVCDNVDNVFIYPEQKASVQNGFPYVTFVFSDTTFSDNSPRGIQSISILGFVTGEDSDLMDKVDALELSIFKAVYKNEKLKTVIKDISNTNLFKPFGFNGGMFPPFAGVRFEIDVPLSLI